MKALSYNHKKSQCQAGQSLVEIIIAMAIFALISVSLVSMILGGLALLTEGGNLIQASALAEEGLEAVRSIRNRAWNELVFEQSAVSASSGRWDFVGEGTSEQIGSFTRVIRFFPVFRDGSGNAVDLSAPEAIIDPGSKIVSVELTWPNSRGASNQRTWLSLLTNWQSFDWAQSDWSGGSGQAEWSDETMFEADDGNIEVGLSGLVSLKEIATSTFAAAGFLESSAFRAEGAKAFNFISWIGDWPSGCSSCAIRLQIKTADDSGGSPGAWSSEWCGPEGEDGDEDDYFFGSNSGLISKDHNGDEWVKYKLMLYGEDDFSPAVSEVKINYN